MSLTRMYRPRRSNSSAGEDMRDAERHSKEAAAGKGSSSDELLAQWRAATADICAVCIPASHLAQMNSWRIVQPHRNRPRELSLLALLRRNTLTYQPAIIYEWLILGLP